MQLNEQLRGTKAELSDFFREESLGLTWCDESGSSINYRDVAAAMMEAGLSQAPSPSDALLALHEQHRTYRSFAEFQPQLQSLLKEGELLDDCITLTRALGILEPITGNHIPPEALLIQGENWRESLIGNGLLSRSRALLSVLEQLYGSLEAIKRRIFTL